MRFLHTSDWQIGKAFGFADDATRAVLHDERLEVIGRLGRLAQAQGATAVLVAGDVYDVADPSDRTLRQPIERMRQFPTLEWHLIPGNHDPHTPNGPWDRLQRAGVPPNVHLHLAPQAQAVGDAVLVPVVLTRRHALGDPTAGMDAIATPEGAIRLGLAHGSLRQFGAEDSTTHNLIAFDRADRAGLAYLALGDWHGGQCFGSGDTGSRSWYSGTPEVDAFDTGGWGGGEALLVQIDGPRALPDVTRHRVGRFKWRREAATLHSITDIDLLETRLRNLQPDLSTLLVSLRVEGALSLAAREAYERRIRGDAASALRALRLDDGRLQPEPSTADLEAIDQGGFVRVAAERLARMAADPAELRRGIAAQALQRLYVLHMRRAGETEAGA
ncbi:metallophosphoesterase family protein [Lichenicoccus roseus]|uniref:DNA repair exonuclease n=1 Tax=Lichenicoccus roseus TaxID=2683649 RepID=A0A5R9J9P5_9PROT|nr:DNA repair exonuclease [Lichenicoccus roseus]TLU74320.1 DNA repair exonuclease [Lichenicoccus roseus]